MSETPHLHGLPAGSVTNGEETETAHLDPEGRLLFAQGQSDLVGPAALDPQDADRLLAQNAPSISVNYRDIYESEFDEYLRGHDGMAVYHQMATDGTVKNALGYLYGSMRSADWRMIPAGDQDEDIEIAAFIADQLGLDGSGASKYTFGRLLQIYNRCLVYGQSFGEIVLSQGSGDRVVLDKIVSIHPLTIDEIKFDRRGGPRQLKISGTVRGGDKTIHDKTIPIWKTVAFVHDDDGTFNGQSFLRAAVAHWRVKRSLIVMINQGMERYLIGVPQITLPKSVRVGSDEWKQAKAILANFVTRPRTGILLQPGWEFEVVKLNVAMPDSKPYLEYHDSAIARALGFDWSSIQSSEGIQNVNVGALEEVTKNTVRTLLIDFTEAINNYLIPKLILPNWPHIRRYPKLQAHLDIKEDFSASANLMGMIINAAKDSLSSQSGGTTTGPDGTSTPAPASWTPEELAATVEALMGVLPPRFKVALGYDEAEIDIRMQQYRTNAQRNYRRDGRKGATRPSRGYRDRTGNSNQKPFGVAKYQKVKPVVSTSTPSRFED